MAVPDLMPHQLLLTAHKAIRPGHRGPIQQGPWTVAPTLPPYVDGQGCSIYNPGFNVTTNSYDPNCQDWTNPVHYDNSDTWQDYNTLGQASHQIYIRDFNGAGETIASVNPDPADPDYQEILSTLSRTYRENSLSGTEAVGIYENNLGDQVAHRHRGIDWPALSDHWQPP